ncbi:unnamed protein product [Phytophthora lilii]|uniref:Unnamed protein product n=2 Tax=Phytophthora lilii TaxID=2077276 RepID=A0A9W6TPU6_9STRA|nr:unnamed protein product [Phytophthora lilii]
MNQIIDDTLRPLSERLTSVEVSSFSNLPPGLKMTREVWFQLVDGEGNAVISADCVECADDAKVFRLRKAVFAEVSRALPATVIAADLTVFAVTQEGKKALEEDSPIGSFGGSKKDALIVQVPRRAEVSLSTPAMNLLQVILPHILANAPTTPTERDGTFKERLCEYYGCFRRKKTWVRCMLLDVAFPRSLVIASHLFRRSNEYLSLAMMQISDIDDAKNGLLLFKPLEYALDHFQISFIRDDSGVFRLKLFDPSIKDTRIIDLKDRKGNDVLTTEQTGVLLDSVSRAKKRCTFDVATTFGNLDGKPLVFTGLERPFYRCLNLQARVARMIALKKNKIDASYDFEDFWTEVSLDDKMEMFHQSIMDADQAMF